MDEVARVARISKATLYGLFPNKAALFGAHVDDMCRALSLDLFSFVDTAQPPAVVLATLGRHFLAAVLRDEAVQTERNVIAEAARYPAWAEAMEAAGPRLSAQLLGRYLEDLGRRAVLAIPDAGLAAEHFIALCQARVGRQRLLGLAPALTPADIERQVDAAVTVFLRGYAAR